MDDSDPCYHTQSSQEWMLADMHQDIVEQKAVSVLFYKSLCLCVSISKVLYQLILITAILTNLSNTIVYALIISHPPLLLYITKIKNIPCSYDNMFCVKPAVSI